MQKKNVLQNLLATPVDVLPDQWKDPQRVLEAKKARQLDAQSPDLYWQWVAKKLRWMSPWNQILEGGFPDFRYFPGATLNVADNCVDLHAENPELADLPAILWEGEPEGDRRQLTYSELRDEVCRCANMLKFLGVKKGDVVALYMQNLPEAYVTIHACNRIGAIYTILFSGFSAEAICTRLDSAQPKVAVIADTSFRRGHQVGLLSTWREAMKQSPEVSATLVFNRSSNAYTLRTNEHDYSTLLAQQSTDCPCEPMEANEPSFLVFTSGTTSKPKGLVHSVAGFLLGAWANVYWQMGAKPGERFWCATDIGWLSSPIQSVIGGLSVGTCQVVYEGSLDYPNHDRFYQIASRYQVQRIITAPTAVRMLRSFGDELAAKYPLPDLKMISLQGEPLDATTYHWPMKHLGGGIPVINAYGQTETGSTWTYPIYGVDDTKAGSCGTPVPGYRAEIVDDNGQQVAVGEQGTLVLTYPIPSLARTIWQDHERYIETYFTRCPGKYWCADAGVQDEDGHLWVLGRVDDVINVAGHRLSTMEIESAISAHPAVTEGAVTGVHDEVKGLVPVAFVVLREGYDIGLVADELKQRVRDSIGGIAKLEGVYVTAAMPKTRTGKIVRRLLREIVEDGDVSSDTSSLDDARTVVAAREAVCY